ncbi:MAG: hypothetical protein OH319_05185 [Candidatus Parvarchaeota archaeon]|nr:hypothetical protein [Candidatus Jingweiarchaeum tengchongense]
MKVKGLKKLKDLEDNQEIIKNNLVEKLQRVANKIKLMTNVEIDFVIVDVTDEFIFLKAYWGLSQAPDFLDVVVKTAVKEELVYITYSPMHVEFQIPIGELMP